MNRSLFVFVAAGLATGAVSASAADLVRKAPLAVPPPVAPFSWTGFYLGGHVGGRTGEFLNLTVIAPAQTYTAEPENFIAGAHLGFNYQMGSIVVGIEGDITDVVRSEDTFALLPPGGGTTRGIFSEVAWEASVRGRLGFAFDRGLVYATGGVAFADINVVASSVTGGVITSVLSDDSTTGWTLGAGVEYALADRFFNTQGDFVLRAEYRYSKFDGDAVNVVPVFGAGAVLNTDLEAHTVRFGVSYLF